MTDNAIQKRQSIPLFDYTTLASGISSIQRNQPFIGAEMANLMKVSDLASYQADSVMDKASISMLVLAAFSIALRKQRPVQVMLYREHWDYILAKKPPEMMELATITEVFCFNPQAITIEFRPMSHD